jgi:hypothetical protein
MDCQVKISYILLISLTIVVPSEKLDNLVRSPTVSSSNSLGIAIKFNVESSIENIASLTLAIRLSNSP